MALREIGTLTSIYFTSMEIFAKIHTGLITKPIKISLGNDKVFIVELADKLGLLQRSFWRTKPLKGEINLENRQIPI